MMRTQGQLSFKRPVNQSRSRQRTPFLLQKKQRRKDPHETSTHGLTLKASKSKLQVEFEQTLVESSTVRGLQRNAGSRKNTNSSISQKSLAQHSMRRMQNILNETTNTSQNKKIIFQAYMAAHYCMHSLRPPTDGFLKKNQIYLNQPTISHPKFLFLNLNETILSRRQSERSGKDKGAYEITFRPKLMHFLCEVSQLFEVYIFSSNSTTFTKAVIDKINRNRPYIKDFLAKDSCFFTKRGYCIKDMRIIKNRQLKDIVLLDSSIYSFGLQLNNGIPIQPFTGSKSDYALLDLMPFLQKLSQAQDVRIQIEKRYGLQALGSLDNHQIKQALFAEEVS